MARTTISLPDELMARLKTLRDHINISAVCRRALEAKVVTHERVQEALSKEDVMEGLIQRLMAQRREETNWAYDTGSEAGRAWAIEDASYSDLIKWSEVSLGEDHLNDIPFPFENVAAEDLYKKAQGIASNENQFFDHGGYARGFLESVRQVWNGVKDKV